MASNPEYKKLSGRAGSLVSHCQLWKGSDHLLLVQEIGCAEEYKRFYFADIQAFITIRSAAYLLWALVFSVAALFMVGAYFSVEEVGRVVWLFVIGGTIAALIIHLVRGPTCKCWVQTGINKERLIMFRRTAQVRRFLSRVEEHIESAQGVFSIAEMESEASAQINESSSSRPAPPVFETT